VGDTQGVTVGSETLALLESLLPDGDWIEAMADEAGRQARLEKLREIAAPELEIAMVGPMGFTGTFHGVEGFFDAWADWLQPFQSYLVEAKDFEVSGERVLFLGRQRGLPKGTDSPIENDSAAVFIFADGRLIRIEFHLDPETARRSAGLGG
jgi:ketosteroid isomerase-like protein